MAEESGNLERTEDGTLWSSQQIHYLARCRIEGYTKSGSQ